MSLRALIIINPVSGRRGKHSIESKIRRYLNRERFDYEVLYTHYAGHGYELAREAAKSGIGLVVAVGGDGLVNEVARGVFYSDTAMGIIPAGSGNGLARHLRIPLKVRKAIDLINRFDTVIIDSFTINGDMLCSNLAGTGFDSFVASKFDGSKKRGLRTYLKIIVKEFFRYSPRNYALMINDKQIDFSAFLVTFANSSQFGNNALIAPMASLEDGMIDVCIMKPFKWYLAPYLGFMLLTGLIDKTNYMTYYQAAEASLILGDNEPCHLNGDPYDSGNRLHVKVNKSSLKVVGKL